MRTITRPALLTGGIALGIALLAPAFCANAAEKPADGGTPAKTAQSAKSASTTAITLKLEGMHCPACGDSVAKGLKKTPGVASAKVDFKKKSVAVSYDPQKCKPEDLVAAVKQAGYRAFLPK